ncbi:MAG: hypothetical protein PHN84_15925 [Desulfuromonadaceae bacterium]|nr:hypothetical protein [Desulfuromonadaceae bacterium]MDD2856393.1 hypothetical protein [Desulfuromonadaceae bacterium]
MTKIKQSLVNGQLSLFDLLAQERVERVATHPGRLCISARLLAAVKLAIKQAPKSRETLADDMSELAGTDVTIGMINNWTAESHPHRMPAELLPAFCAATGSTEPLRIMAEVAGLFTVQGPDALRAEIQKLDEEEKRVAAEKRKHKLLLQTLEHPATLAGTP